MTVEIKKNKEARVIELFNQGKSYQDIARELRISFRDIANILKKARGEESPQDPKKQYSRMYQLFSKGKSPVQVAVTLSLPADYALEQFQNFLKAKRFHRLVEFYDQNGDEGVRIILSIWDAMRKSGNNDLTLAGNYVKSCQNVHEAGYDLESLIQEQRSAMEITNKERKEIGRLQQQKADEQKSLADLDRAIRTKKKELTSVIQSIKRLTDEYPQVTTEQFVNAIVEVKVRSYFDMIDLALASVIHAFKTSPNSRFIVYPETAPPQLISIPDGQRKLQQICIAELNKIAQDYYLRILRNIREAISMESRCKNQ